MNTICLDTGRTWLVAKTGNNGNSGHPSSFPINLASDAKLTIDAAVTAASSGDTIIIWPGDYAENVNAGSKALRFMGFSRTKSKIVPSSGAALTLTDGCAAMNLAVESLTVAISSTGIYSSGKKNIRIEDCDIYAAADGLYISNSEDVLIRNCRIRGKYDGANFGGTSALIVENCVFRADGTYGTTSHSRASLTAASGIFRNCHFIVSRSDNSSQVAAAFYAGGVGRIKFENCMFQAITQSPFNGSVYGFYTDSGDIRADFHGCIFYTCATGTPSAIYDLANGIGGPGVVAGNCIYSSSSGVIVQSDSTWADALANALFVNGAANKLVIDADGRVDVGGIEGAGAELLTRAAKMLLNKAVQDKLTGAIRYYDDDNQTVMLTHTPSEDESNMTRTPS